MIALRSNLSTQVRGIPERVTWQSVRQSRYANSNIEQQLIRQGATPALVRMMSTVHLAAWHGDPSPMEYI